MAFEVARKLGALLRRQGIDGDPAGGSPFRTTEGAGAGVLNGAGGEAANEYLAGIEDVITGEVES